MLSLQLLQLTISILESFLEMFHFIVASVNALLQMLSILLALVMHILDSSSCD